VETAQLTHLICREEESMMADALITGTGQARGERPAASNGIGAGPGAYPHEIIPNSNHRLGDAGVPQLELFVRLAGVRELPASTRDAIDPKGAGQLEFRSFRLLPRARLLSCDGRPVLLGSRAFDLLEVLLRSRGRIVSKQEIVDTVWPTTTVEESNLRFQMASLRKALGDDRDLIKTIPGRGYLFASDPEAGTLSTGANPEDCIAETTEEVSEQPATMPAASIERRHPRAAEDQYRQTLETLASALQFCVEELRQIAAGGALARGVARRRTRPNLRGRIQFPKQRRPRGA
jgi:DNA-binding winged helix-turn-helix (wHTH) protein